jgi:hypothetical protein
MNLGLLVGAATSSRRDQPADLLGWVTTGWHWLVALGAGGVVLALIRLGPKLFDFFAAERQRAHERASEALQQRKRDRDRLGPGLRIMIGVGQALKGIASRLTHDPVNESAAAVASFQDLRDKLHGVQEPELADLQDRFQNVLTSVQQWRALVEGSHRDRQQQLSPADQHRLDRIEKHEDDEPANIEELTAEAEEWLAKLEKPVVEARRKT